MDWLELGQAQGLQEARPSCKASPRGRKNKDDRKTCGLIPPYGRKARPFAANIGVRPDGSNGVPVELVVSILDTYIGVWPPLKSGAVIIVGSAPKWRYVVKILVASFGVRMPAQSKLHPPCMAMVISLWD